MRRSLLSTSPPILHSTNTNDHQTGTYPSLRRQHERRNAIKNYIGCPKTLLFIGLLELTICPTTFYHVNCYDINPTTRTSSISSSSSSSSSSTTTTTTRRISLFTRQYMFPPPGSGYASSAEDYKEIYKTEMPSTYEPMMAFPGTMRPGKTPENMPYQDLPIGDDDPDPVPWPHFQQIEWHHRWSQPPHEHPGTMEDFIDTLGRWATPQQEAAMRAGVRRDLRQRQEVADNERRDMIITDDDDDDDDADEIDDDYIEKDEPVALGDGIFGKLGSDADRAATAAAVSPDNISRNSGSSSTTTPVSTDMEDDGIDDLFADDDLDDFLLDLGLDAELEDDTTIPTNAVGDDDDDPVLSTGGGVLDDDIDPMMDIDIDSTSSDIDAVPSGIGLGVTPAFSMDSDDDFVDMDDDDGDDDSVSTVPLEDFGDGDNLDVEDIFDEGGFDYDDGDYGGGGNDSDIW